MISIDHRTSRSPSPNQNHERRYTADFNINQKYSELQLSKPDPSNLEVTLQPISSLSSKQLLKNNRQSLRVCTCILAGSLYLHKRNCKKINVLIESELVIKKKFSIVEACVFIQREIRKYINKKRNLNTDIFKSDKIEFALFADTSNASCKKRQVCSSVLSSYCWNEKYLDERYPELKERTDTSQSDLGSKLNSQRPEFLEQMMINSDVLKNCRNELDESIDFELSGTFK